MQMSSENSTFQMLVKENWRGGKVFLDFGKVENS